MGISADSVRFDGDQMWVSLSDGRVLGVPLAWFPRLQAADAAVLRTYELSPHGIHWPELDEDVSVEALLKGRGDRSGVGGEAA